ncbi:aldo/keto reductase [Ramlibacter sp.]|uniref:aldo/keto reductase n=1 Tax=Ramlibacter sp. TaxID=1917967 RepID=UPI0017ADDA33|nr:aldo/keto reductase [Ramlibacter sp.]MBA2676080.1 aldo/keto reductase [Ramlibacter sp.]
MNNAASTAALAGVSTLRVGLGCMGMSEFYGPADDEANLRALHTAFALGYRHFDTADMYGRGANEQLLARFVGELGARRAEVLLATKVGIERLADGNIAANSRADYIQAACEASLRRLGVERIGLLYLHRKTPEVPIEETVGAMARLVEQGKVGALGLSEVSAATLERACKTAPIAALQSEYSLWSRDVEAAVLPMCRAHGVKLVAYSPLGRGFLTGAVSPATLAEGDLRRRLPRFQEDNFRANEALLAVVQGIAQALGCSTAQVALAWLLGKGDDVHAIPGSRREANMAANIAALGIRLSPIARRELDAAFAGGAVHGLRYPEALLKTVNV